MELLQDSDLSSVTIGPHWPSSYPEYLSPHQDKDEQRRVVWARLLSQRSNLAGRLSETRACYLALRQELNPRTTQVESSHDLLYRDTIVLVTLLFSFTISAGSLWPYSLRLDFCILWYTQAIRVLFPTLISCPFPLKIFTLRPLIA